MGYEILCMVRFPELFVSPLGEGPTNGGEPAVIPCAVLPGKQATGTVLKNLVSGHGKQTRVVK